MGENIYFKEFSDGVYIFDTKNFELFEIDYETITLLNEGVECSELDKISEKTISFLNDCLDNNLLKFSEKLIKSSYKKSKYPIAESPLYLLIHITESCNLQCQHCYLGDKGQKFLNLDTIITLLEEFKELSGLTVLVSGGEPTLHPNFWELNEIIYDYPFRFELLTNGTTLSKDLITKLNFDEVQISIDGWEYAHNKLRGNGIFIKSISTIQSLIENEINVSVATMITEYNTTSLSDFERLERFCLVNGITNWSVTSPCSIGDWSINKEQAIANNQKAIEVTSKYGYGSGQHDFGIKYACGANLCTIMADGSIIGCVLQPEKIYGTVEKGIKSSWENRTLISIEDTECATCHHLDSCRGGCRVSAKESSGSIYGKDLLQCYAIEAFINAQNEERR